MKYAVSITVAAVLSLAACTQEAPSSVTTYDLSLYPMCEEVQDPTTIVDGCVMTQEPMLHALLVSSSEGNTDVQVVADGEAGQLIQEASTAPMFIPGLADLNGDSQPDLLIPLDLGNVNTTWAVYAGAPDATYTRLGEMTGIGWGPSESGFLAVPARASASSWAIAFIDVEPGALTPMVTAITEMAAENTAPTCRVENVSGALLVGTTEEEVRAQFCAEAAVAGIWTD